MQLGCVSLRGLSYGQWRYLGFCLKSGVSLASNYLFPAKGRKGTILFCFGCISEKWVLATYGGGWAWTSLHFQNLGRNHVWVARRSVSSRFQTWSETIVGQTSVRWPLNWQFVWRGSLKMKMRGFINSALQIASDTRFIDLYSTCVSRCFTSRYRPFEIDDYLQMDCQCQSFFNLPLGVADLAWVLASGVHPKGTDFKATGILT